MKHKDVEALEASPKTPTGSRPAIRYPRFGVLSRFWSIGVALLSVAVAIVRQPGSNRISQYPYACATASWGCCGWIALPLPPDLPVVKGDQARLTQALEEVVDNAVTFTPSGGRVTVKAGTAEDEGQTWMTIAVQDTGPGISPEEQERIFDRFYRGSLAESGHIPGTGLGLSIVQEIVRAHGGRVTVESEMGKGSTFRLWLLLEQREAQSSETAP